MAIKRDPFQDAPPITQGFVQPGRGEAGGASRPSINWEGLRDRNYRPGTAAATTPGQQTQTAPSARPDSGPNPAQPHTSGPAANSTPAPTAPVNPVAAPRQKVIYGNNPHSPFLAAARKAQPVTGPAAFRQAPESPSPAPARAAPAATANPPAAPGRQLFGANRPANPFAKPGEYVFNSAPVPGRFNSQAFRTPRVSTVAGLKPSDQQIAIRDCEDRIVLAKAFAGTGKTTTSVMFTEARPDKRILYLAFSNAIVHEAESRKRFGPNVTVKTGHALAFEATPQWMRKRLTRSWRIGLFQDQMQIDRPRMARLAMSVLKNFLNSGDDVMRPPELGDKDIFEMGPSGLELRSAYELAKTAWSRMNNPDDTIELPDDVYFKRWVLTKPQLRYDNIILDEAQDTNPALFQLLNAQQHAKILYLGDKHQSIFAFRGAENVMESLEGTGTELYLSQTFRFGPRVANLANTLLADLKGETVPIEGLGKDLPFMAAPEMFLARTNGMLIRTAASIEGRGIHWIGGAAKYRIDECHDAYSLFNGDRDKIKTAAIRRFSSWNHLVNDAEESRDKEMLFLSKIVDEFKHELPNLLNKILTNQVATAADADAIFTTAHQSKGLEHNQVRLAEDFDFLDEVEKRLRNGLTLEPAQIQEINLLYVAMTRAKNHLELNEKTSSWFNDLETNRNARAANRKTAIGLAPR